MPHRGIVLVLDGGDEMKVLGENDLGEEIYATPAIADEVCYLRTAGHLWAIGSGPTATNRKENRAAGFPR